MSYTTSHLRTIYFAQFALIRFLARRLDDSASVFVSHSLEPRVSHLKEWEPTERALSCFAKSVS